MLVGLVSVSTFRGEAMVAALSEGEAAIGGGSIEACDVGALVGWAGSGSWGMSSSALVSIVISFVSGGLTRRL